jgi:hypothetical protein
MIHRITRDTTSGDTFADLRVQRKVEKGFGVVECNETRCRVQSGIVKERQNSGLMKIYGGKLPNLNVMTTIAGIVVVVGCVG